MRSILYRNGLAVDHDLAELSDPEDGSVLWIDVEQSETENIQKLAKIFSFHPLALEALLGEPGRSRLDRFENQFLLQAYATRVDADDRLEPLPILAVLTRNTMISVRPAKTIDMEVVRDQWEANPELLSGGSIAMFWSLLDNVVDSHFDTVQALDERTGDLEAGVFADTPNIRELQHSCFILHREVTRLRRLSMPLRDIANSILRHDPEGASGEITPYLQDVYDHALRVADWADNIHDTLSTLFDSILNSQSNQLNIVMKKVTSWAAIIAVPTAITGFFGMNVSYPLFGTVIGFWVSLGLMAASTALLYWQFKRSDWL